MLHQVCYVYCVCNFIYQPVLYILILYTPAPSAPENITANSLNSTSIAVSWLPPSITNGIVRSYRVVYTTGDVVDNTITMDTSVIINMLETFTTYQVQVFATTVVEGNGSGIVVVTTDEDGE